MAFDTSDTLTRSTYSDELLPGTSLFHGQYRILRFINSGGFGITYLAKDSLDRDVVIKECFSSSFCRRTETRVRARSQSTRDQMQRIVKSFLNEARSLAKLTHPNIVGVHQVFEDNDTAYMAMDYIRGHDLLEIIDEKKAVLTPDQIVTIAGKLVSAIGYIHGRGLLHCDVSPDNIFLTHEGEPILIDFGAARRSAAGEAQKYSGLSVVKDGYSPHEMYAAGGNQGPWSDIYSLAASLYHAITGQAPENCQSRLAALAEKRPDPCRPLAGRVPGYPAGFLDSIDRAMAVVAGARFQSAAEWQRALPQPEPKDRKVVLLRRLVPTAAIAEAPAHRATPEARPVPQPVRPRRTFLRGNEADISGLRRISGFIGAWLVDSATGHVLAAEQDERQHDHEAVMAAAVGLGRANLRAMELVDDSVEDILVTLGRRVHLIRPMAQSSKAFLCVAMESESANPGLARVQLRRVEQSIRL
jgi:serine/threonine protein kinase